MDTDRQAGRRERGKEGRTENLGLCSVTITDDLISLAQSGRQAGRQAGRQTNNILFRLECVATLHSTHPDGASEKAARTKDARTVNEQRGQVVGILVNKKLLLAI